MRNVDRPAQLPGDDRERLCLDVRGGEALFRKAADITYLMIGEGIVMLCLPLNLRLEAEEHAAVDIEQKEARSREFSPAE